jgi:hypothetical protein
MGRLRAWLFGLVAGAMAGLVGLAWLPGAQLLALAAIVIGTLAPPRPYGASGALIGAGALLALMLWQADAACRPGECVGPDLVGWYVAAGLLMAAGLSLGLWLAVRRQVPAAD